MAGIQIDGVNNKIDFDDDLDTSISANTDDTLQVEVGGASIATMTASTVVFNEASADVDFRVESNGNTHMLFVDGGNDNVSIGTSAVVQDFGSDRTHLTIRSATGGNYGVFAISGHADNNDQIHGLINFYNETTSVARISSIQESNTSDAYLNFFTAPSGGGITERMRIHGGGVVSIPNGVALGVGTANTASNVLDDYEEGTYAPVFTVASGSLTPHGSHNALAYTKIGRVVHVQGEVRFSAVSSPSGNFSVSLPFAVADLTDGAARSTSGAIGQSGFGGTPDATYYLRITSEGTTTAFFATHNSGSDTGVNANQVSTSTEMILSFTFIAA